MDVGFSLFGIGFAELLILLSGGGLFGLPPGPRDAALLHCPPASTLVYLEWAERSAGKPGAPGIDGLAADPEIRAFFEDLDRAFTTAIDKSPGFQGDKKIIAPLFSLTKLLIHRPGCLYARLERKPGDLNQGANPPNSATNPFAALRATLIVNGGSHADEIASHIGDLLAQSKSTLRTKNLQKQLLPSPVPGVELILHRYEQYFILALDPEAIDHAVAALKGEKSAADGLVKNERFAKAAPRVAFERMASFAWLDVQGLFNKSAEHLGKQGVMLKSTAALAGLDSLDYIATSIGVIDGRVHSKSILATGGRTEGALALTTGRPLKPEDFTQVPADADYVLAFSLNLPKIWAAVKDIAGRSDPAVQEKLEAQVDEFEKESGLKLEEDVFAAFGDAWVIHNSPSQGGLFATSLVAALEVRDAGKAQKALDQLMKHFSQELPTRGAGGIGKQGAFLADQKFLDRTIYFVNTVGDTLSVPVAPSFCLTDRRFLMALHPQALKAQLRFLADKEPAYASRFGKDLTWPAGDVISLSRSDTKSLVSHLYAFVPYIGSVVFTEIQWHGGVPLSLFSLPSARAIVPYVEDSTSTVTRTPEGLMFESRSGLPIPAAFDLLWLLALMGMGGVL